MAKKVAVMLTNEKAPNCANSFEA
ncbi:MAG: hypothetical protein E7B34_33355 [Hafnia alvei]|nr:hypothetical protein [Hafnia alvei]